MPIKRREIRESAFLLIFEKMFRQDEELDDIFMSAMEVNEIIVNDEVKKLVENVCEKQDEIDSIISKFSNKRTVERIPKTFRIWQDKTAGTGRRTADDDYVPAVPAGILQ